MSTWSTAFALVTANVAGGLAIAVQERKNRGIVLKDLGAALGSGFDRFLGLCFGVQLLPSAWLVGSRKQKEAAAKMAAM